MRFVSAMLAMIFCGGVLAEGAADRGTAAGTQQQASNSKTAAPTQPSPAPHTFIQGEADYATCVNNVTGATAIAFTSLGVATTHLPAGGVAGLIFGAGSGRYLVAPLVCVPDQGPDL